ncbi:hypothetical protein KAJ27_02475, partial [bacterium]|nr:hypothetical protein [bacterium]
VIFVGDNEFIPCLRGVKENAPSDTMYTKLAGNDNIPDAMISRFSVKTLEEVEYQVYKAIQYEANPFTGDDAKWYEIGMGIASSQGSPSDSERADALRENLLAYNYKTIYQEYDKGYSSPASKVNVINNINNGCALMNYIGHGSKTVIVSSGFGVNDMGKLKNGLKLPVMWDVACVNGQFNVGSDCFAEGFTKAGSKSSPSGAAIVYASTTNQEWVPPCVVQEEINNEIICNETFTTVGGISANGILKGFEVYGDGNNTSGTMLMEQWTLFGDCTLTFRSKVPEAVAIKASKRGENIMIEVKGSNKALKDAVVTCYDKDLNEVQISNLSEGRCSFTKSSEKPCYVTVSGFNLVPVIDQEVK